MERLESKAIEAPEVVAKARRRQFSAAYKARILREAEACRAPLWGLLPAPEPQLDRSATSRTCRNPAVE